MSTEIPADFCLSKDVAKALRQKTPLVALETAVLTHGLPYPKNVELSRNLENAVSKQGAVPATIGILDGKVHIGLTDEELEFLGTPDSKARKISRRDFGIALARGEKGGTTVAGTMIAARAAGIRVFATGGIGGVHREAPFDVSADLPELSRSPMVVVCAGAKSILDLPATLEVLETMGVPVVGYQTNEFPAFFSRNSGLPVNVSVETPGEVATIARRHWALGIDSAILVVVPPPESEALANSQIEDVIQKAVRDAKALNITGYRVTPFLLSRVNELSGGESLKANLALLENNASIAAQIAVAMLGKNATQNG